MSLFIYCKAHLRLDDLLVVFSDAADLIGDGLSVGGIGCCLLIIELLLVFGALLLHFSVVFGSFGGELHFTVTSQKRQVDLSSV